MNEETIRADFEKFMSDDGKFPRAIERCGAGNYILSQSASSWRVWRNAYHQCLQSPEIQALREDAETERAIQRAADVLPRDWQITVEVEQGSGYVSLYFQGDEIEFGDPSDGIADSIKAAISAAMEKQS